MLSDPSSTKTRSTVSWMQRPNLDVVVVAAFVVDVVGTVVVAVATFVVVVAALVVVGVGVVAEVEVESGGTRIMYGRSWTQSSSNHFPVSAFSDKQRCLSIHFLFGWPKIF